MIIIVQIYTFCIVFPKSDLVYKVFKTLPRLDLEKDVETFNKEFNA